MKNDPQLQQQDIAIWLALHMKFKNLMVPQTYIETICSFLSPKREIRMILMMMLILRGRIVQSDADEIPTKQVSQDIMEEISLTMMNKVKKMTDDDVETKDTTTSCSKLVKRDPEKAPALSLLNQDHVYMKERSSGPEEDSIIRSFVNGKECHDFQLGIEKVSIGKLTSCATISFPGM
ncbi:hypothetical protein Tco_0585336 [Tanacetum coccineum]